MHALPYGFPCCPRCVDSAHAWEFSQPFVREAPCSHGLRNEMHLSSKMALDRSSLHSWFLRLQRNFYNVTSKQAMWPRLLVRPLRTTQLAVISLRTPWEGEIMLASEVVKRVDDELVSNVLQAHFLLSLWIHPLIEVQADFKQLLFHVSSSFLVRCNLTLGPTYSSTLHSPSSVQVAISSKVKAW